MNEKLLELTADIVSAYVSKNRMPAAGLPDVIAEVNSTLARLLLPAEPAPPAQAPAVNPKRSVHPDHIVCLEDGQRFKSLKRHLSTHHGLTPDEYRNKWALAADYPMVAPEYSAARTALAKAMGLGRKPGAKAKSSASKKKSAAK